MQGEVGGSEFAAVPNADTLGHDAAGFLPYQWHQRALQDTSCFADIILGIQCLLDAPRKRLLVVWGDLNPAVLQILFAMFSVHMVYHSRIFPQGLPGSNFSFYNFENG